MSKTKTIYLKSILKNISLDDITGRCKNSFVKEICEKFTSPYQQQFIANFYFNINFINKNTHSISFNNINKFMENDTLKLTIINKFEEGIDYIHDKDDIKLTIHCFCSLLKSCNTPESRVIFEHYKILEKMFHEYRYTQQFINNFPTVYRDYFGKNVFYIFYIRDGLFIKKYKYGESSDIYQRMLDHQNGITIHIELIRCWVCKNKQMAQTIEDMVFLKGAELGINSTYESSKKTYKKEILETNNIDIIIDYVDELVKEYNIKDDEKSQQLTNNGISKEAVKQLSNEIDKEIIEKVIEQIDTLPNQINTENEDIMSCLKYLIDELS
jgi:hypothetical protein